MGPKRQLLIYEIKTSMHEFKTRTETNFLSTKSSKSKPKSKNLPCSKLKQKMLEHNCTHKDNDKTLNICFKCFKLVEVEFGECSHIHSSNLRKLEPSGYSFLLVDNYKRELVNEQSYFQESAEDPKPVRHFMEFLREEMVPFLTDKIVPNTAMQITQLEEQLFKQASSCYCCHRKSC